MNSKWYISTLLIVLALIGLNQEQTKVANQQIVVQFTDVELTSDSTPDDALETITKKLHALGISNIELVESDNTKLTIRYYSDIDASSVGEILSHESELALTYDDVDELPIDYPEDKLPETFSLVVSDLQQQSEDGLGLNGKFAFELNQDYERFSNPVVLMFNATLAQQQDAMVHVAFLVNNAVAIALDNTSDSIPEVRAGPCV